MVISCLITTSCSDDDKDLENSEMNDSSSIFNKLVGSSWKTHAIIFYDYSNNIKSEYDNSKYPTIITFTDYPIYSTPTPYQLWVDLHPYDPSGKWYGYTSGQTQVWYWDIDGIYIDGFPGAGNCLGEILKFSSTELHTKKYLNAENEWYRIDKYVKVEEPTHNFKDKDENSTSNDDTYFYETNFTFTATTTKITVNFYFSDRLSSATIKYGTSSSCSSSKSASVSSKCASATISGLKAGTKYYFKCVAKSTSGKSYTTDAYPAITNYN